MARRGVCKIFLGCQVAIRKSGTLQNILLVLSRWLKVARAIEDRKRVDRVRWYQGGSFEYAHTMEKVTRSAKKEIHFFVVAKRRNQSTGRSIILLWEMWWEEPYALFGFQWNFQACKLARSWDNAILIGVLSVRFCLLLKASVIIWVNNILVPRRLLRVAFCSTSHYSQIHVN